MEPAARELSVQLKLPESLKLLTLLRLRKARRFGGAMQSIWIEHPCDDEFIANTSLWLIFGVDGFV